MKRSIINGLLGRGFAPQPSNHMLSVSLVRRTLSSARPPQGTSLSRLEVLKQRLQDGAPSLTEFVSSPPPTEDLPGSGRLPSWLKVPIPTGREFSQLKESLRELKLHTVRKLFAKTMYSH